MSRRHALRYVYLVKSQSPNPPCVRTRVVCSAEFPASFVDHFNRHNAPHTWSFVLSLDLHSRAISVAPEHVAAAIRRGAASLDARTHLAARLAAHIGVWLNMCPKSQTDTHWLLCTVMAPEKALAATINDYHPR